MTLNTLYASLHAYAAESRIALDGINGKISYSELIDSIERYRDLLKNRYEDQYSIILYGDFNRASIAFLWAAFLEKRMVTPITSTNIPEEDIIKITNADMCFKENTNEFRVFNTEKTKKEIILQYMNQQKAAVVLLSSGTTGKPKAILHNIDKLLNKYLFSKKSYVTLALLLFDHIAGFDTMFYVLASGGSLIVPASVSADAVISSAKEYGAEVLPASPSLIKLLLMDSGFNSDELPDLKIITFGSERIGDDTLNTLKDRFGSKVRLIQKYGITELGNPATITREDDPRYIRFKPGTLEYKIIEDTLYIKSESSMVGYLYSDDYEEFDGWYNTQDKVEIDGEWLRILGRVTDIINVGGQKVYPSEVEAILLQMDGVLEVVVFGKANPIMGLVVAAKLEINTNESPNQLKKRIREHCRGILSPYKIPAHIEIVDKIELSKRFKKVRA